MLQGLARLGAGQHEHELARLRAEISRLQAAADGMEPPSPHEGASSSTAGETLVAYEAPKMYEDPVVEEPPTDVKPSIARGWSKESGPSCSKPPLMRQKSKLVKYNGSSASGRNHHVIKRTFEVAIGAVIALNVMFVFARLEIVGRDIFDTKWAGATNSFEGGFVLIANVFQLCFVAEMVVKLAILRRGFFFAAGEWQKFNMFDLCTVVLTGLDLWVLAPLIAGSNALGSLAIVRVMRFFGLFRALMLLRTLELFEKLRILVNTVTASFAALFWSMVLLSAVMLVAALFLCQVLQTSLLDPTVDGATKEWVYRYYGTPSRATWTVFELTFSGGWPQYVRPLVEQISVAFAFFFFAYISTVVFAMFRIITALFLKDTLAVANRDTDTMIHEKMREKAAYARKLRDFVDAADTSGDGVMSFEEFEAIVVDERVKSYLSSLEIDASEPQSLFQLLNDEDNISADEFVQGAVRLKGHARSQDVVIIKRTVGELTQKLEGIESMLASVYGRPPEPF